MSDQTTPTTTTEPVAVTTTPAVTPPPAAATPPPTEPAPPAASVPLAEVPADQLDAERLRQTVLAQREREAQLQAQLTTARQAEARLAELERAQESDAQRVQRERDEAIANAATAQEALRRGYLLAELAKAEHGIVDAESAAALITGVEFGEDGKPTNAAARITALLDAKGFLKATPVTPEPPRAPAINGGSGTAGAAPPDLTPEQIAFAQKQGISPEKYAAWLNVSTATQAAQAAALLNPST